MLLFRLPHCGRTARPQADPPVNRHAVSVLLTSAADALSGMVEFLNMGFGGSGHEEDED